MTPISKVGESKEIDNRPAGETQVPRRNMVLRSTPLGSIASFRRQTFAQDELDIDMKVSGLVTEAAKVIKDNVRYASGASNCGSCSCSCGCTGSGCP